MLNSSERWAAEYQTPEEIVFDLFGYVFFSRCAIAKIKYPVIYDYLTNKS